ncbi:unnamed protein product [Durusdinium trenchii]|uniref:Mei2-like C-terminal RNA recognition motif domain-containing protein n=1 Tax=Durusdinium trenchii TaxID=1381693 RepID=A0ABP0M0M1_9DINO
MSKMYYHEQCDEMLEDGLTTIMLRRVPPEMTMASLLAFLDGFAAGKYDFVYLPFDRRKEMNIALAFVNFVDPPSARMAFTLLVSGVFESMSNVRVSAANVQGFSTNLAYFIARFGLQAVLQPNAPVVLQAGQVIDVQLAIAMHVTQDLLREAHKLVQAERMGHGQEGSVRRSKRFMWNLESSSDACLAGEHSASQEQLENGGETPNGCAIHVFILSIIRRRKWATCGSSSFKFSEPEACGKGVR